MLCKPKPEIFSTNKPLLFRTSPKKIWEALSKLEKGRASIIFQLRLGHIALNAYLFKHNIESIPSPNCNSCNVPETTDHFLVCCRRFQKQRNASRQAIKKEEIKISPYNLSKLIDCPDIFFLLSDFVLSTNRFPHFRSFISEPDD